MEVASPQTSINSRPDLSGTDGLMVGPSITISSSDSVMSVSGKVHFLAFVIRDAILRRHIEECDADCNRKEYCSTIENKYVTYIVFGS